MAASNTVIITSSTDWGTISKSSFPITITMTANSVGDPTLIRANLNYDIPMGEISGEEDEKAFTTIPFSGEGSYEMIITYDMIKNSVLEGENYIYLSLGYGADIGYDRIDFTFIKESEKGLFVGVSKTPNEYQQIEYLESTGMQYIDTGVNGDAIGTYEIKFNMLGEGYQNYEMYFAGPLSAQVPKLYLNGDTAIVADIGTAAYDLFIKDNNPHTVKITNTEILCDNIIKATYEAKPWGDQSFWLFSAAEQPSLYSTMRLYYLKMYSDGVLVRNYIPCYRKEDNISGLYDIVNNIFYENESMGNFVAGKVVKGITKKAIDMFIGKDGIAKRVKEVFIGINGIAKKFYSVEMVEINILNELKGAEIIINGISYTGVQTIKTIRGASVTARINETDLTENKIYFNGSSVINNVGGGEVEYTFKAEKSYKIDYSAGSTKHYMHIDEINLINFTIEGVSYQAEEGMTWLDWINSKYNTNGYYQNGSVTNIVYAPQENYGFTVGYIDTELIEDGDTISLRDISNVSIEK